MTTLAITLDKSTFQALGQNELIQLNRYYLINITPLLVSEILGDLTKEEKEGKRHPKDVVSSLANKIFPYNCYVNTDYKRLLELSLLGVHNTYDNRPFLDAMKSINTGDKKGYVFEETELEKSINRWKEGEFNSIDDILSWFWKKQTKSETVIDEFKTKLEIFKHIKLEQKSGNNFENLETLKNILIDELDNSDNQLNYLIFAIEFYGIETNIASEILYRWESGQHKSLKDFSPYTYFCLTIISMYYVGLTNNLFSERQTNLVDLEYLYYTPCARVFSSNDKFLITLFDLIRPKNVFFITSQSLKNDLTQYYKFEVDTNTISKRPPIENSETYKIWDSVFDLKTHKLLESKPRSQEELKAELETIFKMAESGKEGTFEGEPDFVTKTYYLKPTDLCVCRSGKQLKDCCLLKG